MKLPQKIYAIKLLEDDDDPKSTYLLAWENLADIDEDYADETFGVYELKEQKNMTITRKLV